MTDTVVRAQIDEHVRQQAAVLVFLPLIPNEETIEAMEAVRRGDVATVHSIDELLTSLNMDDLPVGNVAEGPRENAPAANPSP